MSSPTKSNPIRERIMAALQEDIEIPPERLSDSPEARQVYVTKARRAKVRQIRSQAVSDAFVNHPGKNLDGVVTVRLRGNREVQLGRVEHVELEDGRTCVEVWLGKAGNGPPNFRIENPPTLAEDPQGDIEVHGRRYREDPLAAIAEVVAGGGLK